MTELMEMYPHKTLRTPINDKTACYKAILAFLEVEQHEYSFDRLNKALGHSFVGFREALNLLVEKGFVGIRNIGGTNHFWITSHGATLINTEIWLFAIETL